MPLARRKKVLITKDDAALSDPASAVYYIPQTGEIFADYSGYASRIAFYRLRIFQCEVTGKGNLTFFEALESEKVEARTLQSRFPEPLKYAVLRSVQWQLVGRLDHLVEAVYERFKDRYFEGERVFLDFNLATSDDEQKDYATLKSRTWARILHVHPPPKAKPPNGKRKHTQMENGDEEVPPSIHDIYGDLKVPAAQVNALDNPKAYRYQVQLADESSSNQVDQPEASDFQHGGKVVTVSCEIMSRDRLAFSKSILKRFVRECVDRDAAVASPWTVKKDVAAKYAIDLVMPADIRKDVDAIKKTELDKRKKISEAKENPPKRSRRKAPAATLTEEERAQLAREEEAVKAKKAKDEANRLATTGCKRAVNRWPIEDLDVVVTQKEVEAGKLVKKPAIHTVQEFSAPHMFDKFIMSWVYITTFASAFNITPFTLDDLEATLKHTADGPNPLFDYIHASIISSCRSISQSVAVRNQAAVVSLQEQEDGDIDVDPQIGRDRLVEGLSIYGGGWEKKAVNHETWPNALVSILKEHATIEAIPALPQILAHLLFNPVQVEPKQENGETNPNGTPPSIQYEPIRPRPRYRSLAFEHKIAVLAFICELSTSTKAIHQFLETCENSLTEMRKEKLELKKQQKKTSDQLQALVPKRKGKRGSINGVNGNGGDLSETETDAMDGVELGSDDNPGSPDATFVPNATPTRATRGPRTSLRFRAQSQTHIARQQAAPPTPKEPKPPKLGPKEVESETKRLEEEAVRIDKALESLEVEFRQYIHISRMRPMGKDRFHNRIWWFDGVGALPLLDTDGDVQFGTGRLFIQGPTEEDLAIIAKKASDDTSVGLRRGNEEGEEGMLGQDEWGWYETPEEIHAFLAWLNTKGTRENQLDKAIARWKDHLLNGMNKRLEDVENTAQIRQSRLEGLTKADDDEAVEPYLAYVNRFHGGGH